jgi:hypothetical protein
MEALAILLALSRYALAMASVYLCVLLFRHYRHIGWLILGLSLLDPFVHLLIRLTQGRPLLSYRTTGQTADGLMTISYRWEFPYYWILTVVGLFLLLKAARHEKRA